MSKSENYDKRTQQDFGVVGHVLPTADVRAVFLRLLLLVM